MFKLLADFTILLHLMFILFAIFGGLLLFRWPGIAWVHGPAAGWAVLVEVGGYRCPLTSLENWLRTDEGAYAASFVDYYLMPVVYPMLLTRSLQITLGLLLLLLNLSIYIVWWRTSRRGAG